MGELTKDWLAGLYPTIRTIRRFEQRVALSSFGDGATDQGTAHEAMDLAPTWRLPAAIEGVA